MFHRTLCALAFLATATLGLGSASADGPIVIVHVGEVGGGDPINVERIVGNVLCSIRPNCDADCPLPRPLCPPDA